MIYKQPQSNDEPNGETSPSNASPSKTLHQHEQIFQLMDSTVSFEACLYHQVLPLALSGNGFLLGMVNPEDTAALEYVGRIISYMNYTLVTQAIEVEFHKVVLSAYLKHTQASKPVTESGHSSAKKTQVEKTDVVSPNDKPTFILVEREETSLKDNQAKTQNPSPRLRVVSQTRENKQTSSNAQALPHLAVQVSHQSGSVEVLLTLPPKKLLQELLGRVLEKGIGRLYFERRSLHRGRIVYSQNGNLKCVLPDIPVQVFQELIDQLKQLTHLPLVPVKEPLQAEIERFYQQERLLLRLRVIPGKYGEQATLQVLRGEALKFYQQQQLTSLEAREAWRLERGITQEQMEDLAVQPVLLEKFKTATWEHKVDSYFLTRKASLDQVVYSLIRTRDEGLSQELYFRILEGEQSFSNLAREYSQGPEARTGGLLGPVSLSQPHPTLSKMLSVSQPGQLWSPRAFGEWFVIIRLEEFIPAKLDESMRRRMIDELFDNWLHEQSHQLNVSLIHNNADTIHSPSLFQS